MKLHGTILTSILVLAIATAQSGCTQPDESATDNAATDTEQSETTTEQTSSEPGAVTTGNTTEAGAETSGESAERPVSIAVAELQPTANHTANGTVTFTKVEEGIRVVAEIQGLTGGPGERGFHIHATGDCSAPDASSAGGHFNPAEMPHGAPDDEQRHAGDFGNLTVNAEGVGTADFIDSHISFSGPNSIVGRAVIVHAGTDDLTSQPSGDAGPRAACGVIQVLEY